MAAACPTLAPYCLLHLRLAFFRDKDPPPPTNGSSCSLAQRNWRRCCAKMAADTTHVTTHFYCTAWTTMAVNTDLAIAVTHTACDPRFVWRMKKKSTNCSPAFTRCSATTTKCLGIHVGFHFRNNALHLPDLQLRPLPLLIPALRHRHPGLPARDVRGLNLAEIPPPVRYRTPPSPCSNCTDAPRGQTNVAGPYSHTRG